jgi:excisionase family DNA binding protein
MDATVDDRIAVTVTECGHMGGWGKNTTYKLIADGSLDSFKIGRRRLITIASLRRLIEAQIAEAQIAAQTLVPPTPPPKPAAGGLGGGGKCSR